MAKTILLADDSVTIQKVVELTFMDQDYVVTAVSDGDAALARLAASKPDLLIADVHMPGADGYEVCRRAKESHPSLPVLLLVGTFEPFDEQQAASAGADGHLKKPFDSQDLHSQVQALVGSASSRAGDSPAELAATGQAQSPESHSPDVVDLEPPPLTQEEVTFETAPARPTTPFPLATGAIAAPPQESGFQEPPAFELPAEPIQESAFGGSEDTAPVAIVDRAASSPEDASASSETSFGEPPPQPAPEVVAEPPHPAREAEPPAGVEQTRPMATAEAEAPAAETPAEEAAAGNGHGALSDADVDRIARRVVEMLGDKTLREVAWEVVPDLAELIIKERIRELESQVE